jgi:hypothetical protein
MNTQIEVRPNNSVPDSQLEIIEKLKVFRNGDGFTEYTTGTKTYSEEMQSDGVEDRQIFRVTYPTFLTSRKIHLVN